MFDNVTVKVTLHCANIFTNRKKPKTNYKINLPSLANPEITCL